MFRALYWFSLAAVALVLLSRIGPVDVGEIAPSVESWTASAPWLIGAADDHFSYDGSVVSQIEGTAALQVGPSREHTKLSIVLPITDKLASVLPHDMAGQRMDLRSSVGPGDTLSVEHRIHSATGFGDPRLPETYAVIAVQGVFQLVIDGRPVDREIPGFWSLGHAVRRSDGAIRNQGLIFSPLLRDRTIFSDPGRLEITVILYATPEEETVMLHLVFPLAPPDVQSSD